jgi:aspartate aminotransferase
MTAPELSASTAPGGIARRVAAISESATLAVDARAKALIAAGRPIIGFGAGEPDFPTPDYIVEAAVAACRTTANHRYSPTGGLPRLREAIATKTLRDSRVEVGPDQVLVTNGGKHAVFEALTALLDPGDEVLLPTPHWTTYPEAIRLTGAVPVPVIAGEDQQYLVTTDQLEEAWNPRTKVLILCSPSNPTGAVCSREQLRDLGEWALRRGVWVITDEIYEHFVYEGAESASILEVVPDLGEQCLVVNGVAKTYAMTGWRIGWILGPRGVIKAATNLQSHSTSNVCNVAQAAAYAAVSGDLTAVEHMREAFDRRRRTIVALLNEIPGVVCPEPRGAFYAYASLKGLLGRTIAGETPRTSSDFARLALEKAEVAVVPGEAFGTPGYMRLSYALSDADLVTGVTRLREMVAGG